MNAKQRNAIVRMRKALDNLEAAFEEPKAARGSIKITQGPKIDKRRLAPHYAAKKGKAIPKGHGMSKKGAQQ